MIDLLRVLIRHVEDDEDLFAFSKGLRGIVESTGKVSNYQNFSLPLVTGLENGSIIFRKYHPVVSTDSSGF